MKTHADVLNTIKRCLVKAGMQKDVVDKYLDCAGPASAAKKAAMGLWIKQLPDWQSSRRR